MNVSQDNGHFDLAIFVVDTVHFRRLILSICSQFSARDALPNVKTTWIGAMINTVDGRIPAPLDMNEAL